MVSDVELYTIVKDCIKSHVTEEAVRYANTHSLAYAPLPCSPSSTGWKELSTCVIRGILRYMLLPEDLAGERKTGNSGLDPLRWTVGIKWSNLRSGLKIDAVTDSIISMLKTSGINSSC